MVKDDEFVVMSNRIHGIVILNNTRRGGVSPPVRADRCVCPDVNDNQTKTGRR
jgi:hypothetical protein